MSIGESAAHLAEICDTAVSRELISKVTDKVVDELPLSDRRSGPDLERGWVSKLNARADESEARSPLM